MHPCEVPNPMACPMEIIPTFLPEMSPCQYIDISSSERSLGPSQPLDIEITFKNSGEGLFLFLCWGAEMEGSGNIGGSIEILPTWINKVDHIFGYG